MVDVFNETGNPSTETSSDLLAIDMKIIMADEVIQSIKEAGDIRKVQYEAFKQLRIVQIRATEDIIQVKGKNLQHEE